MRKVRSFWPQFAFAWFSIGIERKNGQIDKSSHFRSNILKNGKRYAFQNDNSELAFDL
jgi:hypothetical protein